MTEHPRQTPEERFLCWAATRPPELTGLLAVVPSEIVTEKYRDALKKLALGKDILLPGDPATADEGVRYIKNQLLALVAKEAGRAQRTGEFARLHEAWGLLTRCTTVTEKPPLEDYATAVPELREVIPTGIERIDAQIRGLARGEMGYIFMPPGKGKTLALINFAVSALVLGHSVLYISVADQSKDELLPRIDTCILGDPCPEFATADQLAARHKAAAKKIKGRLWVADYTDRICSITDIERVIQECDTDEVIVDHADDVVSPFNNDPTATRHSLRLVYMTLKQIARRYDVPIWTASQSDELSWHYRTVGIANTAEAKVGKATGASIILGFSGGPPKDEVPGICYCTIAKARRVFRERTFSLRYDFATSRLY